jgi:hypothetical protein
MWRHGDGDSMSTRGTVEPATVVGHDGRGPLCFQKFVIFLFELG